LLRKQEFIGDIDDDDSLNYVFFPPDPALITNTDSDLAHFKTVLGDAYHDDASTSSTNDEGGIHMILNSGTIIYFAEPCFGG